MALPLPLSLFVCSEIVQTVAADAMLQQFCSTPNGCSRTTATVATNLYHFYSQFLPQVQDKSKVSLNMALPTTLTPRLCCFPTTLTPRLCC